MLLAVEKVIVGKSTCSSHSLELNADCRTLQTLIHLVSGLQVDWLFLGECIAPMMVQRPRLRRPPVSRRPSHSLVVDCPYHRVAADSRRIEPSARWIKFDLVHVWYRPFKHIRLQLEIVSTTTTMVHHVL